MHPICWSFYREPTTTTTEQSLREAINAKKLQRCGNFPNPPFPTLSLTSGSMSSVLSQCIKTGTSKSWICICPPGGESGQWWTRKWWPGRTHPSSQPPIQQPTAPKNLLAVGTPRPPLLLPCSYANIHNAHSAHLHINIFLLCISSKI